ncbi:MAG: hypothetical protein ACLFN4_04025 [Candidatus Acetothermia bacterium]
MMCGKGGGTSCQGRQNLQDESPTSRGGDGRKRTELRTSAFEEMG